MFTFKSKFGSAAGARAVLRVSQGPESLEEKSPLQKQLPDKEIEISYYGLLELHVLLLEMLDPEQYEAVQGNPDYSAKLYENLKKHVLASVGVK